jgi:hypothetical protein
LLFGFLRALISLHKSYPDFFRVIVWDQGYDRRLAESEKAVADGIIPSAYKANRRQAEEEMSPEDRQVREEIHEQMDEVKEALNLVRCLQVGVKGVEGEEAHKLLSKVLDVPPTHQDWPRKEKDFWANLEWQPGGKELWNYIQQYNPNILSAPAVDFSLPSDEQLSPEKNQAIQGKKEWIAKNLSGVGKEIFVPASQKATYASPKSILIDDMKKNTDAWRASSGKAIHHTSASETLKILKEKYKL